MPKLDLSTDDVSMILGCLTVALERNEKSLEKTNSPGIEAAIRRSMDRQLAIHREITRQMNED